MGIQLKRIQPTELKLNQAKLSYAVFMFNIVVLNSSLTFLKMLKKDSGPVLAWRHMLDTMQLLYN